MNVILQKNRTMIKIRGFGLKPWASILSLLLTCNFCEFQFPKLLIGEAYILRVIEPLHEQFGEIYGGQNKSL